MKRNPVRLLCLLGLLAVFCAPTTVRAENYVLVAYVDGGEVLEYEIAIVMGTPDGDPIGMGSPDADPVAMGTPDTDPIGMGSPDADPIVMGTPDSDPILMGTPDGTPIVMGLRRAVTRRF